MLEARAQEDEPITFNFSSLPSGKTKKMDKERDILRDKLSNFAQEPSRDLWPGIEAGIKPAKKRPLWLWATAIAACLALLVMLLLWPGEKVQKTPQVADQQPENIEQQDSISPAPKPMPLEQNLTELETPDAENDNTAEGKNSSEEKKVIEQKNTVKKQLANKPKKKDTQFPKPVQKPNPEKEHIQNLVPQKTIAETAVERPKKNVLFASEIKPMDGEEAALTNNNNLKPKKVVIIRRSKPKVEKASRSYELNIGNTNLLRITRKRSTTKVST